MIDEGEGEEVRVATEGVSGGGFGEPRAASRRRGDERREGWPKTLLDIRGEQRRVSGDECAHAGRVETHLAAEEGENVGDVSLEGLWGRRWMVVGVGAVVTSAAQRADEVRARRERLARASREQVGGAAHEHGDPLEHLGVLVVVGGGEGGERAGERARGDARDSSSRTGSTTTRGGPTGADARADARAAAGRPARAPRHEPRERSRGEHRRHARGGGHPDNLRRPHRGAARALVRPDPPALLLTTNA